MSEKVFLTINELINNIKSKNINIKNENNVRNILETNNYYFIMGYEFAFKNIDGTYKDNVSFEDIYSLYIFDKKLKLIVLDPILEIEQKLKTIYINNYSYRYGFKVNDILDNNYDLSNLITKYDEEIGSLNRNQLLSIMHLPENFGKLKYL